MIRSGTSTSRGYASPARHHRLRWGRENSGGDERLRGSRSRPRRMDGHAPRSARATSPRRVESCLEFFAIARAGAEQRGRVSQPPSRRDSGNVERLSRWTFACSARWRCSMVMCRCRSRQASSGRSSRFCFSTQTARSPASGSSTPSGARTFRTLRRRWCRSTSRTCARRFPNARLHTRRPGYVLEVGDDELDLARFERAFADARHALAQSDPGKASRTARRGARALARARARRVLGAVRETRGRASRGAPPRRARVADRGRPRARPSPRRGR